MTCPFCDGNGVRTSPDGTRWACSACSKMPTLPDPPVNPTRSTLIAAALMAAKRWKLRAERQRERARRLQEERDRLENEVMALEAELDTRTVQRLNVVGGTN